MTPSFERPATLAEATQLLAGGRWALLAGGTDLYPAHVGRDIPVSLLDLSAVAGLRGIRADGGGWTIGAMTTWSDLLRADLPPLFDGLKAAAREVGGVQIQNTATLAGNVCNASPAADGIPALLALDAEVRLQSERGERRLALVDFVLGNRRTARRDDELLVALHIPGRSPAARSVFVKLGGRRYLVISITMVAVSLDLDAVGRVGWAAVAVGSCGARAERLPALEARLLGRSPAALAGVVHAADLAPLTPIDDVRATAAYRLDATGVLLERALRSLERALRVPESAQQGKAP